MPLDFFTFSCPLFEEKFPCEPPVVWNWRVSSLVASLDFGPFLNHELLTEIRDSRLFRDKPQIIFNPNILKEIKVGNK